MTPSSPRPSFLEPRPLMVMQSLSPIGSSSSMTSLSSFVQTPSAAVENPQVSKDTILNYKPERQVVHVDPTVAAYFASLFQAIRQSK